MADYKEDPYAFIIDSCVYSTSQEDFLRCSNLVREDDDVSFCTVAYDSTLQSDLIGVELADDVTNGIDFGEVGFRGERAGSLSPKLTEGDSPLVHCSRKFLIESEGDSMVKVVKPIRCVTADGVECSSDELGFDYGGGEGEILAEDEVHKYETKDTIEESEVEGEKGNENVEKSEENVDTEEIDAGNEGEISAKTEDVLFVETEMIDVDEERGTSVNEEISNVDTEVIGVDEEEGNNNSVKLDEFSDIDTAMSDCDEVLGIADSKVGRVVDEVENCGKIDRESRNVDMKVVGVDNKQGNGGKIDEETVRNVDTMEIVVEDKEEVNCFDVGVEMDNTCKEDDEEQGNRAKMDVKLRDVGMDETANVDSMVDGVDDEQGNCGMIDGNTSNVDTVEVVVKEEEGNGVEIDEEIANLDLEEVKVDVKLRNCAKIHEELSNVDTEEIVVEEEKKNCGDVGVEIRNSTSSEKEIANVDSKVVGVDQDQGNCAKMDGKMIANVELREVGVDDEQWSRGTIDGNISNVDTVEIIVEEEEEKGNCVEIDVEINNTHKDEEIANLESKADRVDEELRNCATIHEESSNVDVEEIAVEEEKKNCGDVGIEMSNSTSRDEESDNKDPKVVGEDQEQGNSAKFNQETSNVVDMEKVVVEEEERNRVDVSVEMNNTSKAHENGAFEIDKDIREGSEKSNEDASQGKGAKKRKLSRSMFEQWGKRIRNEEGCSKDAKLNLNETKKPVSKETAIRCILDAQKFLMVGKSYGGGGKGDFLETAKRRGMTFPMPRFRSD